MYKLVYKIAKALLNKKKKIKTKEKIKIVTNKNTFIQLYMFFFL